MFDSSFTENLTTHWLGQHRFFFPEIGSTNDYLRQHAEQLPNGTLAVTDFQSAGRGRLGRRWIAPAGSSLLFSLLLRPQWSAEQLNWATLIVANGVAHCLQSDYSLAVGLKWPNDLLLQDASGAWRKVAGILTEAGTDSEGRSWVIVGCGLNVNLSADQLPPAITPPTSLQIALARPLARPILLAQLLNQIEKRLESAELGHSPLDEWRNRLVTLGQTVSVVQGETVWEGVAEDVDPFGRLWVRLPTGERQLISAADLSSHPPFTP